jgi:hypothetical protein
MLRNFKITPKSIQAVFAKAKQLVFKLLSQPYTSPKDFPKSPGAYLIYNKAGEVIYVGKAVNLKRRINSDHISGELKISTSTFRRKVVRVHGISPGPEMRKWINQNCQFSYIVIENPDLCDLVESLTILLLRSGNNQLLNH